MKIHFLTDSQDQNVKILQSLLNNQAILSTGLTIPPVADFEVLVAGRPTEEQLSVSRSLKYLVIPFAGLPEETRRLCLLNPQINVYNLHHNALITAELALALLFSAAKFVVQHDQQLRRDEWTLRYQSPSSILLSGKTVVIVGYGQIGRRVAAMCHVLGMKVIVVRQRITSFSDKTPGLIFEPMQNLSNCLAQAQVLMITCPLTEETRGLIGHKELHDMPPGGILVNVGRGAVVDQAALYQALTEGHLAAAGLDVWYNYPETEADRSHTPPADFPFQDLEQVIMSPHRGGLTRETERLRMEHLADLLNRMATSMELPRSVDVIAGY